MEHYPEFFTPIKIAGCEIKNRFAMAPMGPLGLADDEGAFNQRGIDYYVERARGGVGLIITGVSMVDEDVEKHSFPNLPCPTHNPIHFIRTGRELTERVHAYGSKIFIQLTAGFGRVAMPDNLGKFPSVAPSPIPHRWLDRTCRELKVDEILAIVKHCGDAAYNAMRAGFDGVEIHAVHEGYLLDQFAISMFNNRTDEYGGSLENRLRFARQVVEEIKARCGSHFPVGMRYSLKSFIKDWRDGALPGEIFTERGRDIPEGLEAARLLVKYGYDMLDVDVGSYDSWWWSHPPMYHEKGMYRPFARAVREVVDVPVLCSGRMDDPEMAKQALADGTCDMIGLARPLLADADYVNKIHAGKTSKIRPCLSCQEGCMGRVQQYSALNCAVNPQACRERMTALAPAPTPKKVLVAGGGVAGCEAARVLKLRGHQPVLFEQSGQLGGNLIPGGAPKFKEDDHALARWYAEVLDDLGVPIHLNRIAAEADVADGKYDAVIVATGSTPKLFPLGDDARVFTAAEVLMGEKDAGARTVVVGGGLVGCELALWLRQNGIEVTLVEALPKLMALNGPLCTANNDMLERMVPHSGVQVQTSAQAKSYVDGVLTLDNGAVIPCDSVIMAVGYKPNNALYAQLCGKLDELYLLSDARQVSNIMYTIWEAFEVASAL